MPANSKVHSMSEQPSPSSAVVALSGGVDSSLTAALLKSAGWRIAGLHFHLPSTSQVARAREKSARRIAEHLGISYEVADVRDEFEESVIGPFVDAYVKGLTPNPCVSCNVLVKFAKLLRYAEKMGISNIATGHYVRLSKGKGAGGLTVLRGRDEEKDQSYFLHRLNRDHLSRALFPLGEMTKKEVRKRAMEIALPSHSIPESQEICFIPGNDYRLLVEGRIGAGHPGKGNIVDTEGAVVGEHSGVFRYTIGQRHGLGIASSEPYYVKEIRPDTNEIVVARKESLFSRKVNAECFNWIAEPPSGGVVRALAQVRYRHRAAPGLLEVQRKGGVSFTFDDAQWAITPGQALVCYDGDGLIGGGWIKRP